MKKLFSMLLAIIMIASAFTLCTMAAEETVSVGADDRTDHYYFKYDFESVSPQSTVNVQGLTSVDEPDSNPLNLKLDGATSSRVVKENGNQFLRLEYPAKANTSWYGMRFSLYNEANDFNYVITNGVAIDFDFRWIGTGEADSGIAFVKLRRSRGSNLEAFLISANVNANGDLVLTSGSYTIATFPKQGAEGHNPDFTNIRVEYYDATYTYSIYVGGVCVLESMSVDLVADYDFRSKDFIETSYDNDYKATERKNISIAADYWSFELARNNFSSSLNFGYVMDYDNIYISPIGPEDGRVYYYHNNFDSTAVNGLSLGKTDFSYYYRTKDSSTPLDIKVVSEEDGNGYLYFGKYSRMDLRDPYQIIQDGNWTVSFKLQANSSDPTKTNLKNVLRLHNRIDTNQFLQFDGYGNLYLGVKDYYQLIPGVTVPKPGDDKWMEITISCVVNNQGDSGIYSDFVKPTSPANRYSFILWVDGKLVGSLACSDAKFMRSEFGSGNITVNDMQFTQNVLTAELSADELAAKGYALVEETATRKTYYNEYTYDYYQFQYDETGAFTTGVFADFKTTFSSGSKSLTSAEGKAVPTSADWTLSKTGTPSVKDGTETRVDEYIHVKTGDKVAITYTRKEGSTDAFAYKSAALYVVVPSYAQNDVLGFFDQSAGTVTARVDDLKLYSGIGHPDYADDAEDTEGVINAVRFAELATTLDQSGGGNVNAKYGGRPGVIFTSNFNSSKVTAKSETVDGETINYVSLASGENDSTLSLGADHTGGKVFAAELTFRKITNATKVFHLIRLRRQGENDTSAVSQDIIKYSKNSNTIYFDYNGKVAYICDEAGNKLTVSGNEWTTLRVVIDERGNKPLVSVYINGKIANFFTDDALVPRKAINLEGIISDDFSAHRNDADQKVIFFQTIASSANMDLLEAKVEYAEAPVAPVWADSVALDFSKITDLSELGEQFLISDGVYIENGELVVPAGETFGWLDYNGTFADFRAENAPDPTNKYRFNDGYAIEMKVKAAPTTALTGLIKITTDLQKNNNMMYIQNGKVFMSKAISGYDVCDLDSDKYSDISLLYTNNDVRGTVFGDGKMLGVVGIAKGESVTDCTTKEAAITVADNVRIAELYIHRDQQRILAVNSGEIFELDPDAFLPKDPKSDDYYPITRGSSSGVLDSDTNAFKLYAATLNEEGVGNYYSFNMVETAEEITETNNGVMIKGQTWNDAVVTNYTEDNTTVFEYNLRFTPHKNARDNISIQLLGIRRTEDGSSSNKMETLFEVFETGRLTFMGYTLCNADDSTYYLDGSKWVNVAVIYDSNSGKASIVVDGQILRYKNSAGTVIGLANEVQLTNSRYYRMDAADTKIRFLNTGNNSSLSVQALGKLDIDYFKIYTLNATANVGYVGAQKDTTDSNIRLVAGSDMLYYGSVGFDVEAFDADGNSIANQTKTYTTNTVYSSIIENVGGTERAVYPEDRGYRYFYTANVMGVDQENAVKLNVTPFSIVNGVKYPASTVTLDIDFTGAVANWKLSDSDSITVKPTGDNVSANFSTTDIVAYTNKGSLEFNGLDAKFAFAANLKGGVVSVNLTNAKGEVATNSVFDIYVDGVLTQENLTLDFGHHTIVLAEGLKGEHEFVIVKKTGGDYVCINNMSVYGKLIDAPLLSEEDAVIVKVSSPASGVPYGTVNVYAKTSDSSDKYYINYQFSYLNDPISDYNYITGPSNSHYNAKMYRINTATIVDRSGGSDTTVYQLLQGGEISLAIKEGGHVVTKEEFQAAKADAEKYLAAEEAKSSPNDGYISRMKSAISAAADSAAATVSRTAGDFVGGWHGDENIEDGKIAMYLDGVKIDLTRAGTYTGTQFICDQTCLIDRCDEPETQVMRHVQYMIIDTNGFRNNQSVEFLTNDFVPDTAQSYLQMCTFNRQNFSLASTERVKPENYNCSFFNLLDANGKVLSGHDLSKHNVDDGTKTLGSGTKENNRYVEYIGNDKNAGKGLYGRVGFVIPDASVLPSSATVMVRETQGDNKWYASFKSHNGTTIPLGEVWNVNDYYFFDYAPTDYVAPDASK